MSPDPKDSSSTKDAPVEGKDVSKKTDELKAVKQPITLPQGQLRFLECCPFASATF
jgi:hypothetical protein